LKLEVTNYQTMIRLMDAYGPVDLSISFW